MTNYVPGVYRTGRGRTITGTKRKGYNDGEARTGHSMGIHPRWQSDLE